MTVETLIALPRWPYKAMSRKVNKTVDIAVSITEIFSRDLRYIVKAHTALGYFETFQQGKEVASRPLLEFQYHFEEPAQEAHPVFHAHIDSTEWPDEQLKELGLAGRIVRDGAVRAYHNARIPTAFMGFASTLVALAADHLEPKNFRQVAFAAWDGDGGGTEPECSLLATRLGARPPRGHFWYDERYVAHCWRLTKTRCRGAIPVLGERFEAPDIPGVRKCVVEALGGVPIGRIVFVDGEP